MKTCAMEKSIKPLMVLTLIVFLFTATASGYMPEGIEHKGRAGNQAEDQIKTKGKINYTAEKYAPGRVLISITDGNFDAVLSRTKQFKIMDAQRLHPITAITSGYKAQKIKKGRNGRYFFNGKSYNSLNEIDDEEAFKNLVYPSIPRSTQSTFNSYLLKLEKGVNVKRTIARLNKVPGVKAYPDYILNLSMEPNDELYPSQSSLQDIEAEAAWDEAGAYDVVVATVDTGTDIGHEDLKNKLWTNYKEWLEEPNSNDDDANGFIDDIYGYNYEAPLEVNGNVSYPDPWDKHGHGTMVAGISGAHFNNEIGISGICPRARIMTVRVGNDIGNIYLSDAITGIYYAADNGAKVINCSFCTNALYGTSGVRTLNVALTYARSKGAFVVMTAGNEHSCYRPRIMAFIVAAVDANNFKPRWSNYGSNVDIAAPGVNILSTTPQYEVKINKDGKKKNYDTMIGTSISCPQVAGLAALLFSRFPEYSPNMIANMIRAGADPITYSDEYVGIGRINLLHPFYQYSPYFEDCPEILSPMYGDMFRGGIGSAPIQIIGWSPSGYVLSYDNEPYGQYNNRISSSATPVENDVLGSFSTSDKASGTYFIQLLSVNQDQSFLSQVTKVRIDRELIGGWPQHTNPDSSDNLVAVVMSPVAANFGNAGGNRLLAINYSVEEEDQAYLWDSIGSLVYKKKVNDRTGTNPSNGYFYATPALADLNNDGWQEIVFPVYEEGVPVIHVWSPEGTELSDWPKALNSPGAATLCGIPHNAAISDINGDGQYEILLTVEWSDPVTPAQRIIEAHALYANGEPLDGWPKRYNVVVPDNPNGTFAVSNPCLADINNDGIEEFIFAYSNHSNCTINALNSHGAGWQRTIKMDPDYQNNAPVSLAAGDVNNDSYMELYFANMAGKIYGLNKDGATLPNWPPKSNISSVCSSVSLADIDNDNEKDLEIIVQDIDRRTFVYHHNGTLLKPGWPKQVGSQTWVSETYPDFASAPVVGDIDGDGSMDIVQGSNGEDELYAFDRYGNIKPGYPKVLSEAAARSYSTPSLVDLDSDGDIEVVTADHTGTVYVWTRDNAVTGPAPWPVLGQNLRRTYCYNKPPRIDSLDPVSGKEHSVVTITGTGFGRIQGMSKVRFGSAEAEVDSNNGWSNTSINVEVPDLGEIDGIYPVTVITQNGDSNSINFTVNKVDSGETPASAVPLLKPSPGSPSITSLTPDSGWINTMIKIEGRNFGKTRGTSTVKFDVMDANDFVHWSDRAISCLVPNNLLPERYPVTVTTDAGTSNSLNFRVLGAPVITSVAPGEGYRDATITITGSNFGKTQGTNAVRFGTLDAAVTSWSNEAIAFMVPTVTPNNYYPVAVVTPAGTSNAFEFLVIPPPNPHPESVTPSIVPSGRTSNVTINGRFFGSKNGTVYFLYGDGSFVIQPEIVSWKDTSITVAVCDSEYWLCGQYAIYIRDSYGTWGNDILNFIIFFPKPPSISWIKPNSGQVNERVDIVGYYLASWPGERSVVKFGTTDARALAVGPPHIPCVVPDLAPGVYPVTVTTYAGTSRAKNFTVVPASNLPGITSISPPSGYIQQEITIAGYNFGGLDTQSRIVFSSPALRQGGIINTTIISWADTEIRCRLINAVTAAYSVTVENSLGQSNSKNYTVLGPVITDIDPDSENVGATVTITGTDFGATQGTSTVKFDSTVAKITPNGWSDTSISCMVPRVAKGRRAVTVTVAECESKSRKFMVK